MRLFTFWSAVDPWTTWVWTARVHLYMDLCHQILYSTVRMNFLITLSFLQLAFCKNTVYHTHNVQGCAQQRLCYQQGFWSTASSSSLALGESKDPCRFPLRGVRWPNPRFTWRVNSCSILSFPTFPPTPPKKPLSTLQLLLMVGTFLFPYIISIQLYLYNVEIFIIFLLWKMIMGHFDNSHIPTLASSSLLRQFHGHFLVKSITVESRIVSLSLLLSWTFLCWSPPQPGPWATSLLSLHSLPLPSLWL